MADTTDTATAAEQQAPPADTPPAKPRRRAARNTEPAGAHNGAGPGPAAGPELDTEPAGGAQWADTAERADAAELEHQADELELEPDTFTREYVTDLRRESAEHRTRAKDAEARAEQLAQTLWTERVGALGLLADPADLPYDPDTLDDPDAIRRQADELLARRPHLRTRRISARAGQGEGVAAADNVSLTGIMRSRA